MIFMKFSELKLTFGALLFAVCTVNAQEAVRDTVLAKRAVFDVENPRFVWAVQTSPGVLSPGLGSEEYYELKDNRIWFARPGEEIRPEVAVTPLNEDGVVVYESVIKHHSDTDTIGAYCPATGTVFVNGREQYRLSPEGSVYDQTGREVLVIGEDMDRLLSVFYILYFYKQEKETLRLFNATH
jgi:hypothetical protein